MSEENSNTEVNEVQAATEKEARLLGWVPKEEFRDGDHWVDAETFVRRGKEINPILRKNNETLLKKLEERDREIAEVKKVAKEFEKFQKENAERKVQELQKELNTLKEQKKTAVTQGDGDAVVAIDDQIEIIKEQQREAKKAPETVVESSPQATQTLDPVITQWMGENAWFGGDQRLTKLADTIGYKINLAYPELSGKAFFDKLDEELQEVLPEQYRKPGKRSSPVEGAGGSSSRPSSTKKGFEQLPPDAKAACTKFVKQGLMTQEQYLAEYQW